MQIYGLFRIRISSSRRESKDLRYKSLHFWPYARKNRSEIRSTSADFKGLVT